MLAPAEEVVYRGFLMVPCALLAQRHTTKRAGWILGVVASQCLFALGHVPQRWIVGDLHGISLPTDLVLTGVMGIVFAVAFLRTGNLMIAAGFHALWNTPTPIVASPDPSFPHVATLGVMLVMMVAWPVVRARTP